MVKKLIIFAFVFMVFPAPAAKDASAQPASPIVNAIEIRGLKRIDEGAVLSKITQKTGDALGTEQTAEDIKNIFGMGYFDDVSIDVEPFEGGVKLIYKIVEKPVIARINLQGNQELSDDKLLEKLALSPGSIADTVLINDNASKLRSFYEEEGYPLANVVPVARKTAEGEVLLTYQIEEGAKVKIREINITGNKVMSSWKIKKAISTSKWWLLSFITSGGYYKKADMAADVEKIRDLYFDEGYVQVVVSEPKVELTPDKTGMKIGIHVSEGEQFKVSSVAFKGNKAFTEETLGEKTSTRAGDVLRRKTVRADVAAMTEIYSERGYAVVSIFPELVPDEKTRLVQVAFRIDEGDIYSIGRIEVSGNTRTRDKVVRREILLNEGDTFNSTSLRKSYERINNLNFFEEVNIEPKPHPEEKSVDLGISVKERPTGFISVGGGYSSVDKLIGMVDITQGNLGGRGQYLKIRGELGGQSSFYEISFRDPYFLDYPVSFTTSIYKRQRDFIDYNRKSTGFEIGFGKVLSVDWRASFAYSFERATIYEIADMASDMIREQEGTKSTSSISPTVIRDTRDNYLDTHRGSKNALYLTFAGLGGDNKFYKAVVDSTWFFPLGESTFSMRGRYGHAAGISGEKLPLYERFYVGGIYSIRGLGYGEAGPRDENGKVIGGEKEIILNVEYIFPILTSLKLKGVVFFDAGSAFDETFDGLRYTSGLGIRWISPVGPIRIEWGYNIDKRPDEKSSRWEFAFGTFF